MLEYYTKVTFLIELLLVIKELLFCVFKDLKKINKNENILNYYKKEQYYSIIFWLWTLLHYFVVSNLIKS